MEVTVFLTALRQGACGACLPFPSSLRVCSLWPVPLVAAPTYQSMFQEEAVMAWDQAVVVTMFFWVWKLSEGQTRWWWWWWEGTQNPSAETQLSHLLATAWPACPRWPLIPPVTAHLLGRHTNAVSVIMHTPTHPLYPWTLFFACPSFCLFSLPRSDL